MGCGRERIRRALSIVVLSCGMTVLVATSSVDETTDQRFEFGALAFDGEDEVVEGEVGPSGELPQVWTRRAVAVTVRSAPPGSMLLLEILDASGTVEQSAVSTGDFHRLWSEVGCADDGCGGPVTYRIQSLDGERVTIEPSVELEFTAHGDDDEPDVPMEASRPEVVARAGGARADVLASATLRADREESVAAIRVSWSPRTCTPGMAPRIALVPQSVDDEELGGSRLFTTDRKGNEQPLSSSSTNPAAIECREGDAGHVRQSAWVILDAKGATVDLDVAIIGPEGHPPVRIERARVDATPVTRLRGADHHEVGHEVRLSSAPRVPRPVFLLGLRPLPTGVEARYDDDQRVLDGNVVRSADCRRCVHLLLRVALSATESGPPPAEIEAQVVLYEIAVP